jgi:hypothetical protein
MMAKLFHTELKSLYHAYEIIKYLSLLFFPSLCLMRFEAQISLHGTVKHETRQLADSGKPKSMEACFKQGKSVLFKFIKCHCIKLCFHLQNRTATPTLLYFSSQNIKLFLYHTMTFIM